MIALPPVLAPPAPFPLVVAQSAAQEFVAPGIVRSDLRLRTSAGPLVVHVVAVDQSEPTVRFGVVLAHDRLVSPGEKTSSMALRTGAVAGINADYFDIGQTNQPLNIVLQRGTIVRSPSNRIALFVGTDKRVSISYASLRGEVRYGDARVPLTGVNIWPPQGGVSLMTPAYGAPPSSSNVAMVPLAASAPAPAGSSLAFGPAAQALAPPPASASDLAFTMTLSPSLDRVTDAVGGGPLLLRDGRPAVDPSEPAPEERDVRFPVSGAGLTADGTLLLVAVDGRTALDSAGVTRPEFAALFAGLGARDAMAFDSGGSATLVARELGDEHPSVLNSPSDGVERPVADGFFVYSDAPTGPPARLVARLAAAQALPGARITLRGAVVDASGHRLGAVALQPVTADPVPGEHTAVVSGASLDTAVTYRTVDHPSALTIVPPRPNPDPGATLQLTAQGAGAFGEAIALGPVTWTASRGTIRGTGAQASYTAPAGDDTVTAGAGGVQARVAIHVGHHEQALALASATPSWTFAAAPKGAPGSLVLGAGSPPELSLNYDLGAARASYANAILALPGEPLAFSIEVFGDASSAGLRAAFVNLFGERRALTLAKQVDWTGWRRLTVVLPPDLNPPVSLVSLYVARLGEPVRKTSGTIVFRTPSVTLPGSR